MSSTVFILGAGASRDAGAPLMTDFLGAAEDVLRDERASNGTANFQLVFDAIGRLQQVHSKASLPLDHIEHVFSALEMAGTLEQFADYPPEQVARLVAAAPDVIARTLEQRVAFPIRDKHVWAPPPYDEFVELVRRLTRDVARPQSVTVLTFNYDLALDYALHHQVLAHHYGFGDERGVPLLKLHGSLNWRRCLSCDEIRPMPLAELLPRYTWWLHKVPETGRLLLADYPHNCTKCGRTLEQTPWIVPPTWNKLERYRALRAVWARAARELADAENIFVSGYSLPDADTFFPYLYALGTVSMTRLKRFWVFDPDPAVGERFRRLCGPGVTSQFRPFEFVFSGMMSVLNDEFPARSS